ncbi:hypothetical protein FRAHR75_160099 [Frankia sp. Hr75.2]|nr:hypothetical protein FRAHR75_160099 [Frankia sp. Hr75.2]SQD98868.1 hypothetical protein FMEAI12_4960001 [Parafrankia sp. Ea1.12]
MSGTAPRISGRKVTESNFISPSV